MHDFACLFYQPDGAVAHAVVFPAYEAAHAGSAAQSIARFLPSVARVDVWLGEVRHLSLAVETHQPAVRSSGRAGRAAAEGRRRM
jgi:hypothetical protein